MRARARAIQGALRRHRDWAGRAAQAVRERALVRPRDSVERRPRRVDLHRRSRRGDRRSWPARAPSLSCGRRPRASPTRATAVSALPWPRRGRALGCTPTPNRVSAASKRGGVRRAVVHDAEHVFRHARARRCRRACSAWDASGGHHAFILLLFVHRVTVSRRDCICSAAIPRVRATADVHSSDDFLREPAHDTLPLVCLAAATAARWRVVSAAIRTSRRMDVSASA